MKRVVVWGREMVLETAVPPVSITQLGDPEFLRFHGVKCAYKTGAMANGIASEALVVAMGKRG